MFGRWENFSLGRWFLCMAFWSMQNWSKNVQTTRVRAAGLDLLLSIPGQPQALRSFSVMWCMTYENCTVSHNLPVFESKVEATRHFASTRETTCRVSFSRFCTISVFRTPGILECIRIFDGFDGLQTRTVVSTPGSLGRWLFKRWLYSWQQFCSTFLKHLRYEAY